MNKMKAFFKNNPVTITAGIIVGMIILLFILGKIKIESVINNNTVRDESQWYPLKEMHLCLYSPSITLLLTDKPSEIGSDFSAKITEDNIKIFQEVFEEDTKYYSKMLHIGKNLQSVKEFEQILQDNDLSDYATKFCKLENLKNNSELLTFLKEEGETHEKNLSFANKNVIPLIGYKTNRNIIALRTQEYIPSNCLKEALNIQYSFTNDGVLTKWVSVINEKETLLKSVDDEMELVSILSSTYPTMMENCQIIGYSLYSDFNKDNELVYFISVEMKKGPFVISVVFEKKQMENILPSFQKAKINRPKTWEYQYTSKPIDGILVNIEHGENPRIENRRLTYDGISIEITDKNNNEQK